MQVFEVTDTQEAKKIDGYKRVGELLENATDKVLLIVDNEKRDIWLHKGTDTKISTQFIGQTLQQEMKMQLRGFYKTRDFNGLKNDDQRERITNGKIRSGKAEEILKKKQEVEKPAEELKKASELLDESRVRETCVNKGIKVTDALKKAEELDTPDGFRRHMAIIGGSVYNEEEIVDHFLVGEETHKKLKKIGTIPNGFFFLPNMSTRILIERKKVLCLELLVEDNVEFGFKSIRVPLFFKDRLHREGDMNVLLKSFRKPSDDKEATSDSTS